MDEQLKKTEEDTTDVLLEYLSVESASDRNSGSSARNRSKPRSRTASVQKAKAVLREACKRTSHRHSEPEASARSDPANQIQGQELTFTESEGFVIVSNSPMVVPAPCSTGQGSYQSRHLSTSTCGVSLKRSSSSVKRPDTLSLQPSNDPGDPPLFSPNTSEMAQSYPPCGAGLMRMTSYLSSPVLTRSCSPTSARDNVHPQSCMDRHMQSCTSDQIQGQRHCCATSFVSIVYFNIMLILFKLCT